MVPQAPVAKAAMLIRRPVGEVFEAFIEPAMTTNFWFTSSSGRIEAGKRLRWEWQMYGAAADVTVQTVEANRRIVVEWSGGVDAPTTIEWIFTARPDTTTFVEIRNSGFRGDADAVVAQALDATEGFTLVLAGLKALLEHGIALKLVGDRFPDAVMAA
jgi:uncharacterized protein YndB with AHSA1/START domain